MAAPKSSPEGSDRARRDAEAKRRFWLSALVLVGVIVGMTLVFTLNADLFKPAPGTEASVRAEQAQQPAIDRPYSGAPPKRPGDRGGWEQLALLGVIVVALGGGVVAVVHSSRKARRAAPDGDRVNR